MVDLERQAAGVGLAEPPLVVAYAIAGTIRFDIEKDVLAVVDGKEIFLKDIWPLDEEIDAIVAKSVKPSQFNQIYIPMFEKKDTERSVSPLYDWRPQSTYIRRPPYWEGALAGERTMKGMRPLALLPDNITTDHLSPSNAIMLNSAAGEYLHKMGLPEEDFNSYATHRGDHLTAQRATFANPQLVNEMAIVDGQVKKGSLARVEPEGKVMRMWEAIETYMNSPRSIRHICRRPVMLSTPRIMPMTRPLSCCVLCCGSGYRKICRKLSRRRC